MTLKIEEIDFYGLAEARADLQSATLEVAEAARRATLDQDMERLGKILPVLRKATEDLVAFDTGTLEIIKGSEDAWAAARRLEAAYSEFPPDEPVRF